MRPWLPITRTRLVTRRILFSAVVLLLLCKYGLGQRRASRVPCFDWEGDQEDGLWECLKRHRAPELSPPSKGVIAFSEPAEFLRSHLLPDQRYLTNWFSWGTTNEIYQAVNLLHLAKLSGRVPILPALPQGPYYNPPKWHIAMSDVFDLAETARRLEMPIIEAHELKVIDHLRPGLWPASKRHTIPEHAYPPWHPTWSPPAAGIQRDELQCWSFWDARGMGQQNFNDRWDGLGKVDIEITPLPLGLWQGSSVESLSMERLAHHLKTYDPAGHPAEQRSKMLTGQPGSMRPPDSHLACIDFVFYLPLQPDVYASTPDEWADHSSTQNTWRSVGQHMRFQKPLENLAMEWLRAAYFPSYRVGEMPPYIVIHVRRRGFFTEWIQDNQRAFAYHAWRLKEQLATERGISVEHVLLTTDEQDPAWIQPFHHMGVTYLNHTDMRTVERMGPWMLHLIDPIIQAHAIGFVGIAKSTMSVIAARRVLDWNDGLVYLMQEQDRAPEGWQNED